MVKSYVVYVPPTLTDMLFTETSLRCGEVLELTSGAFDPRSHGNNQYFCLKSDTTQVLAYRQNDYLYKFLPPNVGAIKPQNLEQRFLTHALLEDSIKMLSIVGEAGTGKTLLTIAAALEMVYVQRRYERLILTKPRTQVTDGDEPMGEIPGSVLEKMAPQLASYESAMRKAWGSKWADMFQQLMNKGVIQVMPLEHMRGVNFDNAIVVCDEAQNVGFNQYKTLVTRMESSSKLICMGDVRQVDRNHMGPIPLLEIADHRFYKNSELTAHIELLEVERGPLVDLMIRIANNR